MLYSRAWLLTNQWQPQVPRSRGSSKIEEQELDQELKAEV